MAKFVVLAVALGILAWLVVDLVRALRGRSRGKVRFHGPRRDVETVPPLALPPADPAEPGATAENPEPVVSASVIEPRAASAHCRACGQPVRIEAHRVAGKLPGGEVLRAVERRCSHCDRRDERFFVVRAVH